MAQLLRRALADALRQLQDLKPAELVRQRQARLLAFGKIKEIGDAR
jgi:acetyl-CoA carboxylase carboxyl transferase subunit alpha